VESSTTGSSDSATSNPPVTGDELTRRLLVIDDMPTGWSTVDLGNQPKRGLCNNPSITDSIPSNAEALAQFERDPRNGPLFQERLVSFGSESDSAQVIEATRQQGESCTQWTDDQGTVSVGRLSLKVDGADEVIAFRLSITNPKGAKAVVDFVTARRGTIVAAFTYLGLSDDPEATATLAAKGILKLN